MTIMPTPITSHEAGATMVANTARFSNASEPETAYSNAMPNSSVAEAAPDSTMYLMPASSEMRSRQVYAAIPYSGTDSSSRPMNNDAMWHAATSVMAPSVEH